MAWTQSNWVLAAASLLAPPIGALLLWIRRGTRISTKVFGTLALALLSLAYLVQFFGLRVAMDGSGMWPVFSFRDPDSHMRRLEQERAAAAAAPASPAEPKPVDPPPVQSVTSVEASNKPAAPTATAGNYWTDFRGPNREGVYSETPILTAWPSSGLRRLWKQTIGGGYASMVVADGRVYTIEQRRDQEVVAAYDIATGREVWTNLWKAKFTESMGGDGPRTTPVYHAGRVYALGAEGELRCLDAATGKTVWNKNILTENGARNLTWAMSASPLIVDGKVITLPGGDGGRSVVAYDANTGAPVWKALDDEQAYTSPMVATLAGKRQLIVVTALRAVGLTVEDGKLLWEYPWTTEYNVNSAQPIVTGANRFFISAGYGHGAALVEIQPSGAAFQAKTVWENKKMKNKFNSSVLYQGHIYGLDEAILACINVDTGDQKWKGGRYGYGQLLLAGGHLVVLTEDGEIALVKAAPDRHQELAKFSAISGKTWNNPAIAGGVLLVRNESEMAAFRIAP